MPYRICAVALSLIVASAALALPKDSAKLRTHRAAVKDQWIVAFHPGFGGEALARELTSGHGAKVLWHYNRVLNGFAAEMNDAAAAAISADPRVRFVEQDVPMRPSAVQTGTAVTWGLDYIDQRGSFDYSYVYERTGAGVRIYIIDTGISCSPDDFGTRLIHGYTAFSYGTWPYVAPNYDDDFCTSYTRCHGSKVASIAGGSLYGVAKEATIVNVKVLRMDEYGGVTGSAASALAGLNWVVSNHLSYPNVPAVANISLDVAGTEQIAAFEQGVIDAIDAGVVVVCGAGNTVTEYPNNTGESCYSSPARLSRVSAAHSNPRGRTTISVSATEPNGNRAANIHFLSATNQDRWWTANDGYCVDLFAPGSGVRARGVYWYPPDEFAGTSASSPYVAGVVALYLQGMTTYDPNEVKAALLRNATTGVVGNLNVAPNRFVYSRADLWQ